MTLVNNKTLRQRAFQSILLNHCFYIFQSRTRLIGVTGKGPQVDHHFPLSVRNHTARSIHKILVTHVEDLLSLLCAFLVKRLLALSGRHCCQSCG